MAAAWCLFALVRIPQLTLSPTRRLWGELETDALTVPWTLWHVAWQLIHGRSFAGHTAMVAWPEGGTFWPAMPLESLLLVPVTLGAGAVFASNLLQLLHVGLAGGACYALLRRVSGSWAAALAVTPLMALSPVLLCSAHNGNPEAAQLYWLPLAGLATWEAVRRERASLVPVAALVLALAMISNTYVGLAAGVTVLAMAALAATGRWRRLACILGGAGLIAAPILAWAATISMGQGSILQRSAEVVARQRLIQGQASLLDLLVPGTRYALGPGLVPTTFVIGASVGAVAGVLMVVVLLTRRASGPPWRSRLILLGMISVGAFMALGPHLKLGGPLLDSASTGLPLPWLLLDSLPPFSQLIELWRFSMVIHLGAALLIGLWLVRRPRWMAMAVGIALFSEATLLNPGPVVWRSSVTAYSDMGGLFEGLEGGAVLHLPARQGYWPLYFQTLHQRPVASSTERPLDEELFGRLAGPGWTLDSLRTHAHERGFRWLVLHVREDMEALQPVGAVARELEDTGLVTRSHGSLLLVDLQQPGPWPRVVHRSLALPSAGSGAPLLDTGRIPQLDAAPPDPTLPDPELLMRVVVRQTEGEDTPLEQLSMRHEDPDHVMDLLPIEPAARVLDLGCGAGFYTLRLADEVGPGGAVLALDVVESMIDMLQGRLARASSTQLEAIVRPSVCTMGDLDIPAETLDLVFLSHLDYPLFYPLPQPLEDQLTSATRALKVGGHLAVLQYMGVSLEDPQLWAWASAGNIIRNMQAQGLALVVVHHAGQPGAWPGSPDPTGRYDSRLFIFVKPR